MDLTDSISILECVILLVVENVEIGNDVASIGSLALLDETTAVVCYETGNAKKSDTRSVLKLLDLEAGTVLDWTRIQNVHGLAVGRICGEKALAVSQRR